MCDTHAEIVLALIWRTASSLLDVSKPSNHGNQLTTQPSGEPSSSLPKRLSRRLSRFARANADQRKRQSQAITANTHFIGSHDNLLTTIFQTYAVILQRPALLLCSSRVETVAKEHLVDCTHGLHCGTSVRGSVPSFFRVDSVLTFGLVY